MNIYDFLKSNVSSGMSVLNEESMILVMGGNGHTVSVAASCGSTGSSSDCDGTAVCNCQCPIVHPKPKPEKPIKPVNPGKALQPSIL